MSEKFKIFAKILQNAYQSQIFCFECHDGIIDEAWLRILAHHYK
jgi:hypothetical protein